MLQAVLSGSSLFAKLFFLKLKRINLIVEGASIFCIFQIEHTLRLSTPALYKMFHRHIVQSQILYLP